MATFDTLDSLNLHHNDEPTKVAYNRSDMMFCQLT